MISWAPTALPWSANPALVGTRFLLCAGSILEDEHQGMVHYHLPGDDLSWAKVSTGPARPQLGLGKFPLAAALGSFQGGIRFCSNPHPNICQVWGSSPNMFELDKIWCKRENWFREGTQLA